MPCLLEVWAAIPGYEGIYEVSTYGRIKSLARVIQYADGRDRHTVERILKPNVGSHGYACATLNDEYGREERQLVQWLVMSAFVGPRSEGMEVLHGNGNRLDNRLTNLRYGTKQDNENDKIRHGHTTAGEKSVQAKLTDEKVRAIRKLRDDGVSERRIADIIGVTRSCVCGVTQGRRWRHVI